MKSNRPTTYFANPEEAESAFYSAFEMGDMQLMDSVLASDDGCCIHPGALPIVNRDSILESWTQVFSNLISPVIHIETINRKVSDDLAVFVVAEHFAASHQPNAATSLVVATNVYIQQDNGWRMLSHHATHVREQELEQTLVHDAPATLQ
ncbi:MAG: nuclear transport factor 2 family protein [Thiotrichaceae bacterium]